MVRSHFATVHNGEKQYKCTLCDNSYTSRTMVIHHMGKAHDINPYNCSLCEKKFPSNHALKNHRSLVHEGKKRKKPFKCDNCSACFSRKPELTGHIKAKHNEKKSPEALSISVQLLTKKCLDFSHFYCSYSDAGQYFLYVLFFSFAAISQRKAQP